MDGKGVLIVNKYLLFIRYLLGVMEESMKGTIKMIKSMAMVFLNGQTGE